MSDESSADDWGSDLLAETRQALANALKFIESIEYREHGNCPVCGGMNPLSAFAGITHGYYGHEHDCELGKWLGRSCIQFSCDCHNNEVDKRCGNRARFDGKRWKDLSEEEKDSLVNVTLRAPG